MTRPKDLPAALQSWATGNYSAGPSWGGTAQRSAPGAGFLTPNLTLPAEVANYLHGNAFDSVQGAINMAGQMPALNWGAPAAIGATGCAIAWSDAEQAWYAFANSATTVQRSADYGKTWAASGVLAAANGASITDVAFDTSGNVCLITNANSTVQNGPLVAYGTAIAWTNTATTFGAGANGIVFEPSSSLWCVVGGTGTAAAWVYTSSNRTTWAASTIPGTWTATAGANSAIGAGGGILVALYQNYTVTTSFRTMRSANGGITWTNDQAITVNAGITLTGGAGIPTRPVWSSTDGLWYIAVSQASPRKSQVFSSPDGITWTSAATLLTNDCRFVALQCLGSLLVALNDDGRIFCSINKGVSWLRCGATLAPTAITYANNTFRAGGNGLLTLGSTTVAASSRFGLPVTAA